MGWDSLIEVMDERGETAETLGPKVGLSPRTIRAYMYGQIRSVKLELINALVEQLATTESRLREKMANRPLPGKSISISNGINQ